MKRVLAVSLVLLVFAAVLPLMLLHFPAAAEPKAQTTASPAPASTWQPTADSGKKLTVLTSDGPEEMTMRQYLIGVVSAEMPVKFEAEALKAQAVAARTYTMHGVLNGSKHSNADVCTDSGCCQAWHSDAQLKKNWGDNYDANIAKITAAVDQTDGQYLVYNGEPILSAFHSSSGGKTENSGDVWGGGQPYLSSVTSPETADDVPNYVSTVKSSKLDFRDTILYAHPEADFTAEPAKWIGKLSQDSAGRVSTVALGGVTLTGTELRELFKLRSTMFSLKYDGTDFVFSVTGFGHGVGMSQYGANVMAATGSDYNEILTHYYPGTELKSPSKT